MSSGDSKRRVRRSAVRHATTECSIYILKVALVATLFYITKLHVSQLHVALHGSSTYTSTLTRFARTPRSFNMARSFMLPTQGPHDDFVRPNKHFRRSHQVTLWREKRSHEQSITRKAMIRGKIRNTCAPNEEVVRPNQRFRVRFRSTFNNSQPKESSYTLEKCFENAKPCSLPKSSFV